MMRPPQETQPEREPDLYCVDCEIVVGNEPLCPICEEPTLDPERLPARCDILRFAPEGREFGGFQIEKTAAKGAHGLLCRGTHRVLGREAALKLYPLCHSILPHAKGILASARKLAESEHPGIARVYGAGIAGGVLYIARRWAAGESLRRWMEGGNAMGWAVAADLATRIALALEQAHSEGIVHANLKPTNVFWDSSGRVVLTDFGSSAETPTEMHGPESGHYEWSPERWLAREVDGRADLYSLGVILYALLCGRRPFEIHDPHKLMFAHTTLAPPNPANVRPDLPEPLCAIVMKLLEKEVGRRYKDTRELLDDLERLRRGDPVRAHIERKDLLECRFCGTSNAPDQELCSVCREPIRGTEIMLALTQRDDEFQCRLCEHYVRKGSAACSTCMNPTCIRCKAASAESSGTCLACSRPGEAGRSLWGKITDLFGPKRPRGS